MVKKKRKFKTDAFGLVLLTGAGASLGIATVNPGLGLALGATVGTISALDVITRDAKPRKKKRKRSRK